jgi:hypothetical protein
LTSEVALEEREIRSIDPNILIDNNCMDDKLHFKMPGGSGEYEGEDHEREEHDVITTACQQWPAATELKMFDLGTSDFDPYEGEEGNDADDDEEASQANNGTTQNVEDWGHSTRECEE